MDTQDVPQPPPPQFGTHPTSLTDILPLKDKKNAHRQTDRKFRAEIIKNDVQFDHRRRRVKKIGYWYKEVKQV
jgi:hypothetical protein